MVHAWSMGELRMIRDWVAAVRAGESALILSGSQSGSSTYYERLELVWSLSRPRFLVLFHSTAIFITLGP